MKIKEIREKSPGELHKLLTSSREKLRDLRFKIAGKQTKNVREIRKVKKQIAQILFILKERKLKKAQGNEKSSKS